MERQLYNLKVVRVDDMAKTYVVEYASKLFRVHMVPEQLGKGNPGEIVCTIERSSDVLIITQDMETLLRRHYTEGDEVVYRIEKMTNQNYFLRDEYGYTTYLSSKYKINPTITPTLRCRIKAINSKRVHVELVEKISLEHSQFTIGTENLKSLFEQQDVDCHESITALLLSDQVMGSFDSECHRWIYAVSQHSHLDKSMLVKIRSACLSVLEESSLLRDCSANEREVLEERFTSLIEQLGYYIRALNCVEAGKEKNTLEDLLEKLQHTGYVFHPKKMFYIMMCIFLIKSKDGEAQEFLDTMMPKVFDTLRSCDVSNWKRPPFKLVWIKLLEFFIQSLNQNPDRMVTEKEALFNMVQALALQFNLTDEEDEALIDSTLNLSMLYRYCTKVGVLNPRLMLDVAYHTLIGAIQEEPSMIGYTSDPDRMVNVIYNQVTHFTPNTTTSLRYEGKDADVLLDNTSIKIVPKSYYPEDAYAMLPEHLALWNNLQVELYRKPQPIGKVNRSLIKPYKLLWHDIEQDILLSDKKKVQKEELARPKLDDQLSIIITKQTADETPTFECQVVEEGLMPVKGYIRMADMVGYVTPAVGLFSFEKEGKPLVFDAIVSEISEDGAYRFGAKELINSFCSDYRYDHLHYTDTVYCIVVGGNTLTPFFAVSEQGLFFSVRYSPDDMPLQMDKGTVIEVTCIEAGRTGFPNAIFSRIASEKRLTLADAFGTLMLNYSEEVTYETEDVTEEELGTDLIEKVRIKELMNLIDNIASLDSDYIKAYNYLGYCKLLARILEEPQQIHYYDSKMALIELLYEFDVNNCITDELIDRFLTNNGEFFSQHSTLHQQFRKLQIVSYLGKEVHNRELCDIACEASNPELAQLAQLILSYNFMQKTNLAVQASEVQEHIKELLKLQKKENPKKDYGQETFSKEFKTSIVCPPDTMHPDLPRQMHNVLKEICAFLNAEGGVLYIGVDDKTHLERGIEEDLKHPTFEGNKDKYDVYVRNKINQMLTPGEVADHYITTSFDEEAHTPVYVVEIRPCPRPISLDGVFYERRGTSARRVSDEYLNTFINNRLLQATTIEQGRIDEIASTVKESEPTLPVQDDTAVIAKPLDYSTDFASIRTSEVRAYRHKDDDIQPNDLPVFINIFDDNTYSLTDQFLSDCLSIGIYDEEQDRGVLVVVYETGEIAKIPIAEMLDMEMWIPKSINNKSKIAFVSPAMPDEVLSILYHSKNSDYYRFITVDSLDHGTFNTCMRPFYTGPIDCITECEIIPLSERNQYRNFLDLDNDKPGADAKKKEGQKAARLIHTLVGKA